MKDYSGIIQDIKDNITENGKGEITGRDLREILLEAIGNVSVDMGELDRRIEAILGGENYDDIINSWAELEQFLSGLDESSNLAELLSYKAEKSDVYSRSDINTKLEEYTKTDDLGALALKDEVEMSDIKNLEDALDKKLDKAGGEIENNLLVKGELKMGVLFVPTSDGEPSSYRLAIGELGEGADIPSSGEGGLGSVTIMLGDVPYYSDSNGIVRLPAYPTGGGVSGDYLPLSGGTIKGDLSLNQYLRINAWSGYGSGSANVWYNGTTQRLLWENVADMAFGSKLVIHSGNIGSQSVNYATSAGSANLLRIADIRDTNPNPNTLADVSLSAWFSNIWKPTGATWNSGFTVRGWDTEYAVWQLASSANYGGNTQALYYRLGEGSTWYDWRRLLFNNDDNARFLNSSVVDGKYNTALTLQTNVTSRANYLCGLAFNCLGAYSSTYENHTHAWIGLGPVVNSAAAEIYPLVFAVNGDTTVGANPIERMRIFTNGNVAIGTTVDSGYKLDVNGSTRAMSVVTEFSDEINRYGGHLFLQHRGNVAGSQGDARTGNIFMCVNGGNVSIGSYSDNGAKLQVYGNIYASGYQLPTSAPSNPVSGGYYLYVGTLGAGATIS